MEHSAMRSGSNMAIGIGIGAAIGLAAGILLAPKPGRETMEDIKNKAVSTAGTIRSTVRGKAQEAKSAMQDMAGRAETAMKDVKRDMGGPAKTGNKPM